ncbi:MAG TPA: extracellular solute-binding protein [Negativicutes bacterium]|nr:extracellular solute-binding protein [Negativicutes bacterium]
MNGLRRVKLLSTVLVLSLLAFVAGCSLGKEAASPGKGGESKTLAIYNLGSSFGNWKLIAESYASKTGVKPTLDLKHGSGVALAALQAEQKNPVANGAYYPPAFAIEAVNKGLHQAYKPANFDKIPKELKDPDGYWWTTSSVLLGINVNTDVLKKKGLPVPQSYYDLLKPEYRNMVVVGHPGWGGTAYSIAYALNFLLGGNESDFRPGFKYLKALKDNGAKFVEATLTQGTVSGEYPITLDAEANGLTAKYSLKAPVEVLVPKEGVSMMALTMGMTKGAPEAEATKRFFDWLLSAEAQQIIARAYHRPAIEGMIPPDIADRFPDTRGKVVLYDQLHAAKVNRSVREAFAAIVEQGADLESTLRQKGLLK